MLFISAEDFIAKASTMPRLDREEATALAQRMADGDPAAREALVLGCYPLVAAHIRRAPETVRTLRTVYACIKTAEQCVHRFNFPNPRETFASYLSHHLRRCVIRCIAEQC